MFPSLAMIPRYHPQIGLCRILRAAASRPAPVALDGGAAGPVVEGEGLFCLADGSGALRLTLEALDLPAGSVVAVPVYTCASVFEAVRAAGLRCAFVDIDPETFGPDLDSLAGLAGTISSVVLVHTFGYVSDVDAVREAAGGVPVIEDCAHALGSTTAEGVQAGLAGAAGVFSFNFNKPLSCGGGGAVAVSDLSLRDRLRRRLSAQQPSQQRSPIGMARRAARAVLYRRPWYGLIASTGRLHRSRDELTEQVPIDIRPMGRLDRALLAQALPHLPTRLAAQRPWVEALCEMTGCPLPGRRYLQAGRRWNGFLLPALLSSQQQRDEALERFRRRGVDAFVLWKRCLSKAAMYGYRPGQCPAAEDALGRLMLLPCYAELTHGQRRRITRAVEAIWPRTGDPSPGR